MRTYSLLDLLAIILGVVFVTCTITMRSGKEKIITRLVLTSLLVLTGILRTSFFPIVCWGGLWLISIIDFVGYSRHSKRMNQESQNFSNTATYQFSQPPVIPAIRMCGKCGAGNSEDCKSCISCGAYMGEPPYTGETQVLEHDRR